VDSLPVGPTLPLKIWAMDETRVGLHTIRRRRITLRGVKPIGVHQHAFKNLYVYGVIAPASGESLFCLAKTMSGAKFQVFLDRFAAAHVDTLNVVVMDNSATHKAASLLVPTNVVLLFQPPYAPEVNPAERVWRALKDALAWKRWKCLVDLQEYLLELIGGWTEEMLRSLTAYPYIMSALSAHST
jgi:transposase